MDFCTSRDGSGTSKLGADPHKLWLLAYSSLLIPYFMTSQSNLNRIAIRRGGKVMRKHYKIILIFSMQ